MVYYANYLRFIERARTEWLRALGVAQAALKAETGTVFVVSRCEIDFRRPARMDDRLLVLTRPVAARRASLILSQRVTLAERPGAEGEAGAETGTILADATVTVAAIDGGGRPRRLPEPLTRNLSAR